MKVLHVHTAYREGGGEDAAVAIERQLLRDAGAQVVPVDARNPAGTVAAAAALASASWNGHAAGRVEAIARRARVDVVHVHNTWFALTPAVPARLSRAGYPVVATLHNYRLACANGLLFRDGHDCRECLGGGPWPAVVHRCYRDSRAQSVLAAAPIALHARRRTWQRSVDRFLTMTAPAHDIFLQVGLPESRLAHRPHVVADPGPRLQRPSEADSVLFVGRLAPEKGLTTVLEAWRRARPEGLQLLVIGDGPLRHLAGSAPDGVSFIGRLDAAAVSEQMRRARCLVFPSGFAETFGLVAVEAMAAGLPALVSDVGDVPRLTGLAGTDQVLPPGDVDAWADALAGLSGATWLDDVGRRNRERYETTFAPAGAAQALLQIYGQVMAERAARGGAPPPTG